MANNTGKKFGGRKKGARNKRSLEARAIAKEKKCDPLEVMLEAAAGNWDYFGMTEAEVKKLGPRWRFHARTSNAKEAAPYLHSKLKTIEHSGSIKGGLLAQVVGEIHGELEDQEDDEAEREGEA